MAKSKKASGSYTQILKSTSIMGGAAGITMILGLIKTKFAAVLIGANGVGLLATFTAIQTLVNTIASLGLNTSAVRDVAAAVAKDDKQAIGRAVQTIKRMCWLTGILGMFIVATLSPLIGRLTFDTSQYDLEIAALGLVVLFTNASGGQIALIQGFRRIGDIARIRVIAAGIATVITVGFYFWLGLRGIVPALIIAAAIQLILSWRFSRSIPVVRVAMTWRESFDEAGSMVKLGVVMMWTGVLNSLVAYATIGMLTDQYDLHSVGIYSAAFALSGIVVKFVLQAMAADYYPRLTAAAHNKNAMNRLVNEQTEIGLLLAAPGILATLAFAPWIIQLLYTKEFLLAVDLLQWFILGCFIQIVQWPMGFMQLALGRGGVWFSTQTLFSTVHLALIWFAIQYIGLEGVAMAFCGLYVFAIVVIRLVAGYLSGFSWSRKPLEMIVLFGALVLTVFLISKFYPGNYGQIVVGMLVIVTSILCLRGLAHRIGTEHRIIKKISRNTPLRLLFKGIN